MKYPIKSKVLSKHPLKFKILNRMIADTDNAVGQCWPWTKKHIIEIDPRQSPKDYLDTIIHETLHELFPRKKEKDILKAGNSISNLLWRLKYRRVNQSK